MQKNCEHNYIDYNGIFTCKKCGQEDGCVFIDPEDDLFDIRKNNSNIHIWDRIYSSKKYIDESLDYLHGKHIGELSIQCWSMIIQEVPEFFTWSTVFKSFQLGNVTEHWLSFPFWVDLNVNIPLKAKDMARRYCNLSINEKNRVPYVYLLYKFTQLFKNTNEEIEANIPMKATKIWLTKADAWWMTICERKNWKFIPSKIHLIHYEKKRILEQIKKSMKIGGQTFWEKEELKETLKKTTIIVQPDPNKIKRKRRKKEVIKDLVITSINLFNMDKDGNIYIDKNKVGVYENDNKEDDDFFIELIE